MRQSGECLWAILASLGFAACAAGADVNASAIPIWDFFSGFTL